MAVSNKIKGLLAIRGKKSIDLAAYLGMTPQSMRNKFARDSFSAADLIKIAYFLGIDLAFIVDDTQKIMLDMSDISEGVADLNGGGGM